MALFRFISIRQKLQLVMAITSGAALLIACVAFVALGTIGFRQEVKRGLEVLASVIGSSAAASLDLEDKKSAQEFIDSLQHSPEINAGCLYRSKKVSIDKTGKILDDTTSFSQVSTNYWTNFVYASYSRSGTDMAAIPANPPAVGFHPRLFEYVLDIKNPNEERVGMVYLRFDRDTVSQFLWRSIRIVLVVLLFATTVALLLGAHFQRLITVPVMELLRTARTVSRSKNYEVRATRHADDEVGQLVDGFNEMLTQIQTRDRELQLHREHLEEQVLERTRELTRVNQDLVTAKEAAEQAHQAADAANRAKSQFLANMSHEIRTPMNAILGFAQLMLREHDLTPRQTEYLTSISRSGDHPLALISDVLEISRIEAGKLELNESTIDLRGLLADLEQTFRSRAAAKGLQRTTELLGDGPRYVVTDEGKLRQVLSNLVGNGVKFAAEGGVAVRVRTEPLGAASARLVAEVEDTGAGIGARDLPRLFRKFEQTDVGLRAGGAGLGLAISREFVHLMGGDVSARSEPGVGSVFRFHVLVREGRADALVQRASFRSVRSLVTGQPRYRVLVADDREDNRVVLTRMLERVGFEVQAVTDGEEAVREFESFRPHLVLMDMRMPVLDGRAAIARIRTSARGDVKIISVTASAFEEDRREALACGADDFISKPFREQELYAKIRAVLGLEYTYDDADGTPEQGGTSERIDSVALARLAPALVDRLRRAVLSADLDVVLELLDLVKAEDAGVARALRGMAERFEYKRILAVLAAGSA